MFKFKIKQDENVTEMKLNKTFRKIDEDVHRIIVTGNVVVTLHWNSNLETWNKEAELNTFQL